MSVRAREAMPGEVAATLERTGTRRDFDARPAYQRNDYLRWIASAKTPATRTRRIARMIDELERGGVYMGMMHRPSRKQAGGAGEPAS